MTLIKFTTKTNIWSQDRHFDECGYGKVLKTHHFLNDLQIDIDAYRQNLREMPWLLDMVISPSISHTNSGKLQFNNKFVVETYAPRDNGNNYHNNMHFTIE